MIAEAATWRQPQERRRSAARQKTNAALRDALAQHDRSPPDGPSQESVAQTATEPTTPSRRFVVPNVIGGEAPVVRKPGCTFADVLRTCDAEYRRIYGAQLTKQQDKVLREMLACYTPMLGTHEWICDDCGTVVELPNGCNNRHCCTCGAVKRRQWAEKTSSQILPVEYGHLILTVPQPITQLAMINPREMYSMVLREGAYAVIRCSSRLGRLVNHYYPKTA